jgi:hypothetical protein
MARILTNLILISFGYPPLYIKDGEKKAYYQYLADVQAYGGEADLLFEFMADLVIRSQELVSDAIEGKDIEELDDLDKKVELLKIHLRGKKKFVSIVYNDIKVNLRDIFFSPFAEKLRASIGKISGLFSDLQILTYPLNDSFSFLRSISTDLNWHLLGIGSALDDEGLKYILLDFRFKKFRDQDNDFDLRAMLIIELANFSLNFKCVVHKSQFFETSNLESLFNKKESLISLPYKHEYSEKEITKIVKLIQNEIVETISNETGIDV